MPDYKEMHFTLFRATTKAITALQEAQQKTEQMYMDDDTENNLILLYPDKTEEENGESTELEWTNTTLV